MRITHVLHDEKRTEEGWMMDGLYKMFLHDDSLQDRSLSYRYLQRERSNARTHLDIPQEWHCCAMSASVGNIDLEVAEQVDPAEVEMELCLPKLARD
jgi:hypothetical protein